MLGIPENREIAVQTICCTPDIYPSLLNTFNSIGKEKDYKVVTEFKSVQLIYKTGEVQMVPHVIHVIVYHMPKPVILEI